MGQTEIDQYNSYKIDIVKAKVQSLRNSINNGEISFFYQSIYLPVDSTVVKEKTVSEFSVKALRPLGLNGWDIVGIVPKTLGLGLENSSFGSTMGTTWGAGVGGNVVGVYVLLKKEISATRNFSDEFLEEYISENISEFATESEARMLSDMLSRKLKEESRKLEEERRITNNDVHITKDEFSKLTYRQKFAVTEYGYWLSQDDAEVVGKMLGSIVRERDIIPFCQTNGKKVLSFEK